MDEFLRRIKVEPMVLNSQQLRFTKYKDEKEEKEQNKNLVLIGNFIEDFKDKT